MTEFGPFEFAHGLDDTRIEEEWIRIAAENAKDASERLAKVVAERDRLRTALVGIVGVDGRAELERMEVVMRTMPAPAEDKARTIDAIHALLATLRE
jgi:hypothetical protein